MLRSVSVRGQLGPLTVWVSNEDAPTGPPPNPRTNRGRREEAALATEAENNGRETYHFRLTSRYWTKVYEQTHEPSQRQYKVLDFSDNPVVMKPGQVRAIYIHSTLPGDEAIVYDNTRHVNPYGRAGYWGRPTRPAGHEASQPRYQDDMIAIYTGKAHLSTTPFGQVNIWGWDNAWRDYREFVGQLDYGAVFQLWQPNLHPRFGTKFDECARTLMALQRRWDSPVSMLPDEAIYYILNMCKWDWFDDQCSQLKDQRRGRKARIREAAKQDEIVRMQQEEDSKMPAASRPDADHSTCDNERNNRASVGSEDSVFYDAHEQMETCNEDQDSDSGSGTDEAKERALAEVFGDKEEEEDSSSSNGGDGNEMEEDLDEEDFEGESEESEVDSDDEDWDTANGYRANPSFLTFTYASSDEEEEANDSDDDDEEEREQRHAWFRRHYARIHILRALAQAENEESDVVQMQFD